jgi:Ca2+/Na+ antiporter
VAGQILPATTSLILSLLSILVLMIFIKKQGLEIKNDKASNIIFYIYCFLLTHAMVPFIQPRLYWWIIPIYLIYIFGFSVYKNNKVIEYHPYN